jgi:hypothetical protein
VAVEVGVSNFLAEQVSWRNHGYQRMEHHRDFTDQFRKGAPYLRLVHQNGQEITMQFTGVSRDKREVIFEWLKVILENEDD